MRFRPRRLYPQDVLRLGTKKIWLHPNVAKYYEITDIIYHDNRFLYITAIDYHLNLLQYQDITDKVETHY